MPRQFITNPVPGKMIVVSLSHQSLRTYTNGQVVFAAPVTTGRITLQTPRGIFFIFQKATRVTFYSPWSQDSLNYYPPEHANYAMKITTSGIYLHDAVWRSVFGPGTEFPHVDPTFGPEDGSHGCVNMP